MKSIVAPLSPSNLSIRLIYSLKSGFPDSIYLLKSINLLQLVYNDLKINHNSINYLLCNYYFFPFQ